MRCKLCLTIHGIRYLPLEKLNNYSKIDFMVKIEWRGSGRILPGGIKKTYTSKQYVQPDGAVCWNQQFNHVCKLNKTNTQNYKSWIIQLELQELNQNSNGRIQIIGKTEIDLAEYANDFTHKTIRLPMKCNIKEEMVDIVLEARLNLIQHRSKKFALSKPRACSFRSIPCICLTDLNQSDRWTIYPTIRGSSSEDELEVKYEDLATTNLLLISQSEGQTEKLDKEKEFYQQESPRQIKEQSSLVRLLSTKRNLSFKTINHLKGEPLLNKARGNFGGDDIDNERAHLHYIDPLREKSETIVQPENQSIGFEDEDRFEVGVWEKKRIVSRDEQMELTSNIFLASIDQRNEKAAGTGACSVLAVVMAYWLHKNPKTLPLRCQFDQLLQEGSLEWRKLCEDENYKKFSDHHFDLDTVLEANIRPLLEDKKMSCVGFFRINNIPDSILSLHEMMTFDSIWTEILHNAVTDEHIYIASWNDHFFVLKIESTAIYLIDTLGERLFEGCNQAYILKFDEDSVICRPHKKSASRAGESSQSSAQNTAGLEEDEKTSEEVICRGFLACKEYIKGFLAALPLRGLEEDAKRGVVEESILHRLLQIEFHYTAPCSERS